MTPRTTDRPQMSVEDFEELASRAPETVRLEFINGKVQVKPVPDGSHGQIVMWLIKHCMQQRPELSLFPEQGLKVEGYRRGRARPDGVLAPDENFVGQGQWAEPAGVLMTVEVTSYDQDADRRDRVEKPDGYAASGIPVYLLVDRDAGEVRVYADPEAGRYRSLVRRAFGDAVELPEPVGITLDTAKLKEYAD
ncbi:Uma2 family endonuclease [Streptomyces sp. NPDC018029]|uniref:Uma2 family endonuclease n=1 Tax=Streptomyces sp. NPDC018029 TaxID=3365032 RepID=UPI0037AE316C